MELPDRLHLKTITAKGSHIILVARDDNRKRWVVNVTDFRPYFFVPKSDIKILKKRGLEYVETPIVGLDDEPLYQVYVDNPTQVGKRRKGFSKTYEADVPYPRRFLIDSGIKDGFRVTRGDIMGNVILCDHAGVEALDYRNEDRQLLYDIETNKPDGSDTWSPAIFAKGPVSSFTYHDTEDNGTIHSYLWHHTRGTRGHPRTEVRNRYSRGHGRHVDWHIHWFGSEREMFEDLLADLKVRSTDTMSAWSGHFGHKKMKNAGGYDIPYLVNRLPRIGLSASNWSPTGTAFAGYKNFGKEAKSGKWQCYVDGMQLIDSMCVGAKHLVLKPDLSWVKVGDLKVGDKVASFDEYPTVNDTRSKPRRSYSIGTVTHNEVVMRDAFEVELEDGTKIITTENHPWLVKNYDNMHKWVETKDLMRTKTRVQKVIEPHGLIDTREMGWLAGILDGEGSIKQLKGGIGSRLSIQVTQNRGRVLDEIIRVLNKHNYSYSVMDRRKRGPRTESERGLSKTPYSKCQDIQITGGREEALRILQETRPFRFIEKFRWDNMGFVMVKPKFRIGVISVQPIGKYPISNLSVDTKTYIVEGFLMHNTTMQVKDGGMMPSIPDSSLKGVVYKTTKDDPEGPIELDKGVRGNIDWFWEHETDTFLEYAFDDVDAQIVLEKRHGYTDWIRNLQQFVGAEDANRLFTPMALISTMTHRIAREDGVAVPTANQDHDEAEASGEDHTTGGFVMEPKQKGLQDVMAILDLDAMYVNIIRSCNLSWETWVEDPTDEEKESLICVPETDYGPQYFLQPSQKVGLSAKVSSYFKKGREVYDKQIKLETDADKITALKKARDPAKQLTLAVWGNTLSPYFQLYREQVGASILGMGRYIITGVDRFLQGHGYVIQYSDTDSVFIALKTQYDVENPTEKQKKAIIEEGWHLCDLINEWFDEMTSELNIHEHTLHIGFENLLSPFVQGSQKKQYAGRVVWSEGSWQDKEKFLVKGVPGIKTDAAPITQRVTDTIIKMMLRRKDPFDVLQYVYDIYETALDGDIDLADVVKAQTLSSLPDPKKDAKGLHYITKAAWVGMRQYEFEYEAGSRVRLVKLLGDKVTVAIPEGMDIPDDLPVDWAAHIDGTILDAVKGVMDWIDMADQMESIRVGSTPTRTNALP